MLAINVFSGHILAVFSLPVILAARATTRSADAQAKQGPGTRTATQEALYAALLVFALLFGARTALTCINCVLQRRHLMVWAIFAPKFVLDSAALLAVHALAIVVQSMGGPDGDTDGGP